MANECNTNSYSYDSTPVKGTSNSILWVGGDIICNGEKLVCNNTRLTELQLVFATKICTLIGVTDMSGISSFTCSTDLMGQLQTTFNALMVSSSDNPTILQLFNLVLTQLCATNTNIANVIDGSTPIENFDPIIDVSYPIGEDGKPCCNDDCIPTPVKLSEHIQKILLCLCETKSDLEALEDRVVILEGEVVDLNADIATINRTLDGVVGVPGVLSRLTALESGLALCCP